MLNTEQITGNEILQIIESENLSEQLLDRMHAINFLQNVLSYDDQIEEIYTRVVYLNGKYLNSSIKSYKYFDHQSPALQLKKEEDATIDDLKDILINNETSRKLLIANEIKEIQELKEKSLTLK